MKSTLKTAVMISLCFTLIVIIGATLPGAIQAEQSTLKDNLHHHISILASAEFQGRGVDTEGIGKARDYIVDIFSELKLHPFGGQVGYIQSWRQLLPAIGKKVDMENIIARTPVKSDSPQGEGEGFVIVCAHYDHLGIIKKMEKDATTVSFYPGADDNASGIAVLIELARLAAGNPDALRNPVIFAAFSGEEAGCFGSKHFVGDMPQKYRDKILGVINLDTIGRLRDNKLYVMGWQSSAGWKNLFQETVSSGPLQYSFIPQELDSSDQTSFINQSIPAIQLFTGPHQDYHQITDTPDKVNVDGLVFITDYVWELMKNLSGQSKPLAFKVREMAIQQNQSDPGSIRQVSTGITPDFTWSGKGVKILEIRDKTAAQKAGLQKGDVITHLGDVAINDLKGYAAELRKFKPEESCTITYIRSEKVFQTSIQFDAKK